MKEKLNDKGFTLIEILVVIAIIAILFITLLPQIDNASVKARETSIRNDFRIFQLAGTNYMQENVGETFTVVDFNKILDPALKFDETTKLSAKGDAWTTPYEVNVSDTSKKIVVTSVGKDETKNTDDDYIMAVYYNDGAIESCTRGFQTNNVELSSFKVVNDKCGEDLM